MLSILLILIIIIFIVYFYNKQNDKVINTPTEGFYFNNNINNNVNNFDDTKECQNKKYIHAEEDPLLPQYAKYDRLNTKEPQRTMFDSLTYYY